MLRIGPICLASESPGVLSSVTLLPTDVIKTLYERKAAVCGAHLIQVRQVAIFAGLCECVWR